MAGTQDREDQITKNETEGREGGRERGRGRMEGREGDEEKGTKFSERRLGRLEEGILRVPGALHLSL